MEDSREYPIDFKYEIDIAAKKAIKYGTDFITDSIEYMANQVGVYGCCDSGIISPYLKNGACLQEEREGFFCCRSAFYSEIETRVLDRIEEILSDSTSE